jgi:hypothetical protein
VPGGSGIVPVEQETGEKIVTVGENVGLNRYLFTNHPLDREPASINLGLDAGDDHPLAAVSNRHGETPFNSEFRIQKSGVKSRAKAEAKSEAEQKKAETEVRMDLDFYFS